MKKIISILLASVLLLSTAALAQESDNEATYKLAQTGQAECYDGSGNVIEPVEGEAFYGQDAQFDSYAFSFADNGDETVTDNVTGLMWQQIPVSENMTWEEAIDYCENLELAGYDDWRIPTAKELFGISDFTTGWPYLDTEYFDFPEASEIGPGGNGGPQDGSTQDGGPQGSGTEGSDKAAGASLLDTDSDTESEMAPPPASDSEEGGISKSQGQFWSANFYIVGTANNGSPTAFGVNHATGHIKAYPSEVGGPMGKYVRAVRGDEVAINAFVDNGNGTITDSATGLMWSQDDSGAGMEWEEALEYAEKSEYAGFTDWRLPNVKELQSIVDYTGVYPAIDETFFNISELDENINYYFWTSTSAYFSTQAPDNAYAWYVAFGKAVGNDGEDSHGAGAVRFSPKFVDSPYAGEGGDNILNSVRLVRNID